MIRGVIKKTHPPKRQYRGSEQGKNRTSDFIRIKHSPFPTSIPRERARETDNLISFANKPTGPNVNTAGAGQENDWDRYFFGPKIILSSPRDRRTPTGSLTRTKVVGLYAATNRLQTAGSVKKTITFQQRTKPAFYSRKFCVTFPWFRTFFANL